MKNVNFNTGWYMGEDEVIEEFGPMEPIAESPVAGGEDPSPAPAPPGNLINESDLEQAWIAAGKPTDVKGVLDVFMKVGQEKLGDDKIALRKWEYAVNQGLRSIRPDITKEPPVPGEEEPPDRDHLDDDDPMVTLGDKIRDLGPEAVDAVVKYMSGPATGAQTMSGSEHHRDDPEIIAAIQARYPDAPGGETTEKTVPGSTDESHHSGTELGKFASLLTEHLANTNRS